MGYYINGIGVSHRDKVSQLVNKHNAKETDDTFKPDLVCVVDNGPFAAAGYAYSEEERNEFARNDGRTKIWLVVPNAAKLSGFE